MPKAPSAQTKNTVSSTHARSKRVHRSNTTGTANNTNSQQTNILQTAAEFFAEQGYAAASTAALANRCGVSKALLFHYYSSKEAILFDLLDGYTRHLLQLAHDVQASEPSASQRLPALIRAFLATYESSRARHIVLLNDVKYLPPKQRLGVLDHERELLAVFAEALRAAYPRQVSNATAKPLAMMLFGTINWAFTWLHPRGRIGYSDFSEAVIALLESGLPGAARALR
jgi:AcrR family transcriptional regulator